MEQPTSFVRRIPKKVKIVVEQKGEQKEGKTKNRKHPYRKKVIVESDPYHQYRGKAKGRCCPSCESMAIGDLFTKQVGSDSYGKQVKEVLKAGQFFLATSYPDGGCPEVYKHVTGRGDKRGTCEWREVISGTKKTERPHRGMGHISWGSANTHWDPSF